ncbi:MAG: hypothetical protein LAO04_04215 [Acidobacteriia bacterium]|nr:hypothetical protein [Terriglobia bacterium]
MSLGGEGACSTDPATQSAINDAFPQGVTVVVAASEPSMDFDRLGSKDFLSTIWAEGHKTGFQLEEPRLEKKPEKAAVKKEKHSVKAHHTKP